MPLKDYFSCNRFVMKLGFRNEKQKRTAQSRGPSFYIRSGVVWLNWDVFRSRCMGSGTADARQDVEIELLVV